MKNTQITIKDIAKATGLSLTSVSNILRGNMLYAEETRKSVWDTEHKLQYIPDKQAQDLRKRQNGDLRANNHLIMRIDYINTESSIGNDMEARRSQIFKWEVVRRGYFPTVYWYNEHTGFRCPVLLNGLIDYIEKRPPPCNAFLIPPVFNSGKTFQPCLPIEKNIIIENENLNNKKNA